MFWGIILRSGITYELEVEQAFHVSRAVVPILTHDLRTLPCFENLNVAVYVALKNQRFQLCSLNCESYQASLDLNFHHGEKILFSMVNGGCGHDPEVHLTGYFLQEDKEAAGGVDDEEGDARSERSGSNGAVRKKSQSGSKAGRGRGKSASDSSPEEWQQRVEMLEAENVELKEEISRLKRKG